MEKLKIGFIGLEERGVAYGMTNGSSGTTGHEGGDLLTRESITQINSLFD